MQELRIEGLTAARRHGRVLDLDALTETELRGEDAQLLDLACQTAQRRFRRHCELADRSGFRVHAGLRDDAAQMRCDALADARAVGHTDVERLLPALDVDAVEEPRLRLRKERRRA